LGLLDVSTRGLYGGYRALNPSALPILADALEDAGCNDLEILGPLRAKFKHFDPCMRVIELLKEKIP
jgi:hypothetical protein